MSTEKGLFLPDGSFQSDEEIKWRLMMDDAAQNKTVQTFPDKHKPSAKYDDVTRHIKQARELSKNLEVGQEHGVWQVNAHYPDLPIAFTFMTDIHYGNMGVDYDLLNSHFEIIENTPNMFAVIGGDVVDNFGLKHAHAGIMGDAISPQQQIDTMMSKLSDLDQKGKLGAVQIGNHDDWLELAGLQFEHFMSGLTCPVYGAGGTLDIIHGKETYNVWWGHTHWGNSKINPTNATKRALEYTAPDCEVALIGHTHVADSVIFDKAGKRKIGVVGGTYKLSDKLGRKWGLGVVGEAGYTLMLWPNTHKMELVREPLTASEFIRGMAT